jgi:ferrochelatase
MTARHDEIGVIISNLGSPDAPTEAAVRRYLAEFLWDPRVVQIPRPVWWLILHGIVLRTRPRKSAANYQKIWTAEGSPLIAISRRQADALSGVLVEKYGPGLTMALGMRYGNPSLAAALEPLREKRISRLLLLPLYPQYSGATTASTCDAVDTALAAWPQQPELRVVSDYHNEPLYIGAVTASIREYWECAGRGEVLLFSFHGMPERTRLAGDPYFDQCLNTAELIANELDLSAGQWIMTFQSRFGAEEWLQPYTDKTLIELASRGINSVDIVCPGFSADCLETLEEIAMQNHELFLQNGGERYQYIPALNDRRDHIRMLEKLVTSHIEDWLRAG